ncbi:MAG: LytTR family transcriptional regulator [Bacteroidia bacterium]|nr:LytTR family transcriptional regulator [Bacteroidia bacterium]
MEHPIGDSFGRRLITIAGLTTIAFLHTLLLWHYSAATFLAAALDGSLSTLLFGLLAYLAWYIVSFVHLFQADVITWALALLLWSFGCFTIQDITMQITGVSYTPFLVSLPFRLSFALPTWCAVMLWYRLLTVEESLNRQKVEEERSEADGEENEESSTPTVPEERLDRISVKNGTKIHLIAVDDLRYIQACGDYVTLVTPSGQYIKEQTMKYFEAHLPKQTFVRIHRSTIVNVTQISRVELFGKENYQLLLKSGDKLRVSLSGYRLLKERLEL